MAFRSLAEILELAAEECGATADTRQMLGWVRPTVSRSPHMLAAVHRHVEKILARPEFLPYRAEIRARLMAATRVSIGDAN